MPEPAAARARARSQAVPRPAPLRRAQTQPRSQPQPRPRLRVVDASRQRADRRQRTARAVLVLGFGLAAMLLFAVAACHAFLVSGQSRVDSLQRQVADEQARYSLRRLHIDELEAPERIVREANQRLGMVSPDAVTYLTPSSQTAEAVGALDREEASQTSPTSGRGWADVKRALGTRP